MDEAPLVLVTGATGYVGGRLATRLEASGRRVRCLARRPDYLTGRFGDRVEVVAGDVMDRPSLDAALRGVHTAFYLIHAMGDGPEFEAAERTGATNFASAAKAAGVPRLVYLGGLADPEQDLSAHMRSRLATGEHLRASGIPLIEFRASIILGSGSLSFEIIRALVERLPIMITPSWVRLAAQPIAIDDVIDYLEAAIDLPGAGTVVEIGGPDVVSYGDLMREYARQRGLRRLLIPVPVLTPRISSLWLGLITPVFARVGRTLIESIRHPSIVGEPQAARRFAVEPMPVRAAMAAALSTEERAMRGTRWFGSVASSRVTPYGGLRFGNRLVDSRTLGVDAPPDAVFRAVERIGGTTGWYFGQWLWRLRGFIDLLAGGVGMRRGRSHPTRLRPGDVVDCWRVDKIEPGERLRLVAEMRLPGRAWLDFDVTPEGAGARLTQTATFDPLGLSGLLYWFGIWPLHVLVFRGMIRGVARAARLDSAG